MATEKQKPDGLIGEFSSLELVGLLQQIQEIYIETSLSERSSTEAFGKALKRLIPNGAKRERLDLAANIIKSLMEDDVSPTQFSSIRVFRTHDPNSMRLDIEFND